MPLAAPVIRTTIPSVADHGRLDVLFDNAGYGIRREVEAVRGDEGERRFAVPARPRQARP